VRRLVATLEKSLVASFLALTSVLSVACAGENGARVPLSRADTTANLPEGHPPLGAGGGALPGLSVAARASLDSANAAYRAKNFDLALRHYRAAARTAPTHASPWFGILMVAQATNNSALADSARKEVQKRTGAGGGAADSMLRGVHSAPAPTSKS
jgi:hypothetical protein